METITTTSAPLLSDKLQSLELFLKNNESGIPSNKTLQKVADDLYDLLALYSHDPVLNSCKKAAILLTDHLDRLNLVTVNDFAREFFKWLPEFETKRECFEALNSQYKDAYGVHKFQSFEEFRQYLGMA